MRCHLYYFHLACENEIVLIRMFPPQLLRYFHFECLLELATIFLATSYASHSQNIEHQSPHHKTHWGYKGAIGPSHWGDMDEKFSMCGKGKMQTPINIVATNDINLTPITCS
jgi:carbonic anhydrase